MQERMDRMFSRYFLSTQLLENGKKHNGKINVVKMPLSDVYETDKEVLAKIELPGIEKKDVHLNITENMIEVKAEKKHEAEISKKGYYKQERSYSGYYRTFPLPAKIDPNKVKASMKDGLLEIRAPKSGRLDGAKRVQIQ